jgi:hypothetical protein
LGQDQDLLLRFTRELVGLEHSDDVGPQSRENSPGSRRSTAGSDSLAMRSLEALPVSTAQRKIVSLFRSSTVSDTSSCRWTPAK